MAVAGRLQVALPVALLVALCPIGRGLLSGCGRATVQFGLGWYCFGACLGGEETLGCLGFPLVYFSRWSCSTFNMLIN